jgi:saccharopepsin
MEAHGRHLSQKYMGIRPQKHSEMMFQDTSIHDDKGGHSVPVSNFMNAQCKLFRYTMD